MAKRKKTKPITKQEKKTSWYAIQTKATNPHNQQATAEIFLFDEIGMWGITAADFAADLRELGNNTHITLNINSGGGSVIEGYAIYNEILAHKGRVDVVITGIAASIASYIAMAGTTLHIYKNSRLMVHRSSTWSYGNEEDLQADAALLQSMDADILRAYMTRVTVEEDVMKQAIEAETYYTATEALEIGLVDGIIAKDEDPETDPKDTMFKHTYVNRVPAQGIPMPGIIQPPVGPEYTPTNAQTILPVSNVPPIINIVEPTNEGMVNMTPEEKKAYDEKIRKEAQAAERDRVKKIRAQAVLLKTKPDLVDTLISDGVAVPEAYEQMITAAAQPMMTIPPKGITPAGHVARDEADKFRNAASAALRQASGDKLDETEAKEIARADLPRSIQALARHCLDKAGVRGVTIMNSAQLAEATLQHAQNSMSSGSTGDFTSILADTINKSFAKGYEEANETYRAFTADLPVNDFRDYNLTKLSSFSDIELVNEGDTFKHGAFSDSKEVGNVKTYGKMFTLSRQAMVNDDMGFITRIPAAMGRAHERKINRDVYDALFANANMTEDGVALFNSAHNNLAGSGAAPSSTTLYAGSNAMMKQTLQKGEKSQADAYTNVIPSYILAPVALRSSIDPIVRSAYDPSATNGIKYNEFGPGGSTSLRPVYDAYMDSNSTTAWYLAANATRLDTIYVLNLMGRRSPTLRSEPSRVGQAQGISWEVFGDWGILVGDFRGLYKNPGA